MGLWDGLETGLSIPRKFLSSLRQQATVLPEVFHSGLRDQPVRRIPQMVSRISLEDVVSPLLAGYMYLQLNKMLGTYLAGSSDSEDEYDSYSWFCFYLVAQTIFLALGGLVTAFTWIRKPVQAFVRSEILAIEASNTLVNLGDRGCGLIRLPQPFESLSEDDLRRLPDNTPAYAIHSRSKRAWYVDRQRNALEIRPFNFTKFKEQFPPANKVGQFIVATRAQLDAISALTGRTHEKLPMTLCDEAKCGSVINTLRSRATFYATGGLIWTLNGVGKTGHYVTTALNMPLYARAAFLSLWYLAEGMAVISNGRYILQSSVPELCADHQMVYLQHYVENSLALGVSHWAMCEVIIRGIEYLSGCPRDLYEKFVREYMLLFSQSIAAHMQKAPPVITSTRWHDPVGALRCTADVVFEIARVGSGMVLPPLFKDRPEGPSLAEWFMRIKTAREFLIVRYLEFIFIPRMLRSKKAFTEDPVVAPSWEYVRQLMIKILGVVEIIHKKLLVQAATKVPGSAGKIAQKFFGLPESMVTHLLILLGNPEAMEACRDLRRHLFAMVPVSGRNEDLDLLIDLEPLRSDEESPVHPADMVEASSSGVSPTRVMEDAQSLILGYNRPAPSSSSDTSENPEESEERITPEEIIMGRRGSGSGGAVKDGPTPSDIIFRHPVSSANYGFFQSRRQPTDPGAIILGRRHGL